jgi:hypothetical protein
MLQLVPSEDTVPVAVAAFVIAKPIVLPVKSLSEFSVPTM